MQGVCDAGGPFIGGGYSGGQGSSASGRRSKVECGWVVACGGRGGEFVAQTCDAHVVPTKHLLLHAANRPDTSDAADDVEKARERADGGDATLVAQSAVDVFQFLAVWRRIRIEPSAMGEESSSGDAAQARSSPGYLIYK